MADTALTAIARLEADLEATSKDIEPYEHALLAHRLGVAYAEAAAGRPDEQLRKALRCFDAAAALLDPQFHPLEHARVLTAAGSARRSLGNARGAFDLFSRASRLAADRANRDERAAMVNNIGLALLELGDVGGAIERFDEAIDAFDTAGAEGRRGRAAALHNRGLARGASCRLRDLVAAISDHDLALVAVSYDEAPLHHGLVHHCRGVAAAAIADAEADREAAARWRATAVEAFTAALDVFSWPEHAVHHGIVSFNLGRMSAGEGDVTELRRALVSFEDAVTAFDPRHQRAPWREAYDALLATETRLGADHPGWRRSDHLVALLHADPDGAPRVVRHRVARWLTLPARARDAALADFVTAAVHTDGDAGAGALVLVLSAAMELPIETQAAVLDAVLAVRAASDARGREVADRLVDRAVGEAVVGPQRIFVRDHLMAGGFERP